jgi:hypothetical protein
VFLDELPWLASPRSGFLSALDHFCEMKWSGGPFVIDKRYAATLRERAEIFRRVTGTRKSLFLTFVTAHGLAPGDYVTELVANEVSAAALFEP